MLPPIRKKRKRGSLYLRELPPEIKSMYKAFCARRGISMTQHLLAFMKECIKEDALDTLVEAKDG